MTNFNAQTKTALIVSAALLTLSTPALAAGSHEGGHGAAAEMMAVGMPGEIKDVRKTVKITMKETPDNAMIFDPAEVSFKKGQTIRFIIKNAGEFEHEFVLDDHDSVMEHKDLMERFPEMEHDDPNAVRLQPGEVGQIVWTFANDGSFEFACLIPGHYELGMHGDVTITQ
ncbi:MAG: cupredoxin domain-containing protein [Devosia sp.]